MKTTFPQEVDAACDKALAAFGFHSPRRGSLLIAVDDDFYGWVGLNRSKVGDAVRMNPFIGLHCVPVMRLYYELDTYRKRKYRLGDTATVALHLGELAPDLNVFMFEQAQALEDEADRLAQAVVEFGLPWMKSHAKLDALLVLLREKEAMLGGFPERIAVVLFLLGRFAEVSEYLDARLDEYARKPAWAEIQASWKQFSDGLRSRLPKN